MMYEDLKDHLQKNLDALQGDWIKKRSAYEDELCRLLGMEREKAGAGNHRYWDARWRGHFIEMKKGNTVWFNLVRYSEVLVKVSNEASQATVTLFFIPNKEKNRIEEIFGVETAKIIQNFAPALDEQAARFLIQFKGKVPHDLQAQADLRLDDVRELADFSVGGNIARSIREFRRLYPEEFAEWIKKKNEGKLKG